MKIDFYEEFPTKENLNRFGLIKFKTRLFIAAKSLDEFKKLEKQTKKINRKVKCAYWPIIPNSYWISPFSNTEDLVKLFRELDSCKNNLLIDLELPMLNKRLFIKNFFRFRKNKEIIRKFLMKNKERITTAQLPISLTMLNKFLGLDYNINTEKSLMWYSSMCSKLLNRIIKKNIRVIKNKDSYSISIGTIDTGILGDEQILSPKKLERDIQFVKRCGFKNIIIFRLGGLNRGYLGVINKFI